MPSRSRSRKLSSKNRVRKSLKRNTRKSLKRNKRKSLKINTRKTKRRQRVNMRGGVANTKKTIKDTTATLNEVQGAINKEKLPDWRNRTSVKTQTIPERKGDLYDILKNKNTLKQYNRTHPEDNIPLPQEINRDYFTDDIPLYRPLGQNIDDSGFVLKPGCYMFVLTTSNYMYIYGPCTDSKASILKLECCKKEIRGWWPWFRYRVVHPLLPGRDEKVLTAGLFYFRNRKVYVSNNSGHYRPKPFTDYHKSVIEQKLRAKLVPADYIFTFESMTEDEDKDEEEEEDDY
jgi:hypothetical protein